MTASVACGSWLAVCVTGAAPTDAPTTSARTAGRAACPRSFTSSSFATTTRTATTRTTATADEEAEVLPVRRHFGFQASPMLIQSSLVIQTNTLHYPAGPLLWLALRFRSVPTCSGTPRRPMALALTMSRPTDSLSSFANRHSPGLPPPTPADKSMPIGTSRPTSAHSISAGAKSTRAYRAALRPRHCGEPLSVSRPYRRLTPASGAKPQPNGGPLPQFVRALYPMGFYTYPPYRCRS
ncbi:hypothetical protein PF011_g11582 [Phytophthora fragariae]|uniref:Secreted protein n=2 Tax=Phytophthora fragariae TaxID=53985 RepID=A0A6A3KKV4_9STRA|nr:hypothetical protein PF011_g11582 [Phytophthora fragariae]